MKTIIRQDGRKFIVSNALFEEIKRKGILEDYGDLNGSKFNPTTGSYGYNNIPTSSVTSDGNQQKNQQSLNQKENINEPYKKEKLLELNNQEKLYNEIMDCLARVYDVYMKFVRAGQENCPYCIVYRSDKFQRNVVQLWKRIAKIIIKDENKRTEKEKEILSKIDFNKSMNDNMIEQVGKFYNV